MPKDKSRGKGKGKAKAAPISGLQGYGVWTQFLPVNCDYTLKRHSIPI